MLQRIKTDYLKISDRPAIIEVEGGVTIHIDTNNDVTIKGHNNLDFDCKGDLNFNAKNINMNASEVMFLESKTHLVQKAPRIDLNPVEKETLYMKYRENRKNNNGS